MNNYELLGLVIKFIWATFVYTTMAWVVLYGIGLLIGGLWTLFDKEKTNEKYNRN